MRKAENILLKTIQVLLFAALASPLVYTASFLFPYYAPAIFAFQLIIEIAVILFAILLVINPEFRPKLTILTLSLTAFFIIQLLLLFASVEPQRSFLGAPERMAGVWNLLHFYFFFIIATSISRANNKLATQLTVGSILVAIIISIKYLVLLADPTVPFAQYSFGNPSFIASYIALHIPLVVWIMLNVKNREEKIGLLAIIILFSAIVISAQNRGTIIALFIGLLALGIYLLMQKKRGIFIVALLITLFIGSYAALFANRDTQFIKNNYLLTKLTHWSLSEGTIHNRLILWNSAFRGFLDRPLLGWGRENFQHVFEKYYDPTFYITSPSEPWIDRAHNVIFDELVVGGLVNMLAGMVVIISFIISLIKSAKEHAWSKHFAFIFSIFFVIYGFQALFTLDTIATYLPLFLALTIIAIRLQEQKPDNLLPANKQRFIKIGAAVIAIGMIFGSIQFTVIPAIANHHAGKLLYVIPYSLNTFEAEHKALDSIIPDDNSFKADLLMIEAFHIQVIAGANQRDTRVAPFEEAIIPKLDAAIAKNPDAYLKLIIYKHIVLNDLARKTGDKKLQEESVAFWESLIKTYPNRQLFLFNAASANDAAGNFDRSVEILREIINITPTAPKTPQTYWILGDILRKAKRDKESIEAYSQAIKLKYEPTEIIEMISVANYLSTFPEGLVTARDLYIKAVNADPKSAAFHANLAYIYGKLGEKELAIAEAQIAAELDPSHKVDIENFIKNL